MTTHPGLTPADAETCRVAGIPAPPAAARLEVVPTGDRLFDLGSQAEPPEARWRFGWKTGVRLMVYGPNPMGGVTYMIGHEAYVAGVAAIRLMVDAP